MDFITSQIESIRWLLSPVGFATVLALTGVILSGLPGAIILRFEGVTAARRSGDREKISS